MASKRDRAKAFLEGPKSKEPFDVWPNDKDHFPPFPFPFFLHKEVNGWKFVKYHQVRATGYAGHLPEHILSETDFIALIQVGKGYAYLHRGPLYDVIGEYSVIS